MINSNSIWVGIRPLYLIINHDEALRNEEEPLIILVQAFKDVFKSLIRVCTVCTVFGSSFPHVRIPCR